MRSSVLKQTLIMWFLSVGIVLLVDWAGGEEPALLSRPGPFLLKSLLVSAIAGYLIHRVYLKSGFLQDSDKSKER